MFYGDELPFLFGANHHKSYDCHELSSLPYEAFTAEKIYIVLYLRWLVTFRWNLLPPLHMEGLRR